MPDYQNTIIYKLVCDDLDIQECYIGSTTNFRRRKNEHKSRCTNVNSPHHNYKCYVAIRENGGWENWSMVEIEKFPCNDNNEARARERYWFEELHSNLNMCYPERTKQEWFDTHKDEKREYDKIRNAENRDARLTLNKIRYEKNKEKLKEKLTCECGCKISRGRMTEHKKTKKHLAYIQRQAEEQ